MESMQAWLKFIVETDRLKQVYRQTEITGHSRRENSAEHSWHLALMAVLMMDAANARDLDLLKVVKMLLIHDIVEIDAGDTFAYDEQGHQDKEERETKAAQRIFGLLPEEQREEMMALWREFEEHRTPEAKFALALDRFHPMLLNFHTEGAAWRKHHVTSRQVLERNQVIAEGSEALWDVARKLVDEAVSRGYLEP